MASAAMLGLLGLPPPLLRLIHRSRSLAEAASDGERLFDGLMVGRTDNWSPFGSLAAPLCGLPSRCSFLNSMYCLAAVDNGNGDVSVGTSAPFCRRSSATANGFLCDGEVGREFGDKEDPDACSVEVEDECLCEKPAEVGDAGSAAASARKTACVDRTRSREFGLARNARACNTF